MTKKLCSSFVLALFLCSSMSAKDLANKVSSGVNQLLPTAANTPGAFGAFFKTKIDFLNPTPFISRRTSESLRTCDAELLHSLMSCAMRSH